MHSEKPVTVSIARTVVSGREAEFERWADELTSVASQFPGFLGAGLLRPGGHSATWHVVYRFDSPDRLGAWERSAERADVLANGAELVETTEIQRVSGLETWFALPGRASQAPAKWKMYCVSCAAIYVLQFCAYELAGPYMVKWPLALRLLPVIMVITAAMTWLIMPVLAARLARWLYPGPQVSTGWKRIFGARDERAID